MLTGAAGAAGEVVRGPAAAAAAEAAGGLSTGSAAAATRVAVARDPMGLDASLLAVAAQAANIVTKTALPVPGAAEVTTAAVSAAEAAAEQEATTLPPPAEAAVVVGWREEEVVLGCSSPPSAAECWCAVMDDGLTLVVHDVTKRWTHAAEVAGELEEMMGLTVGANLYCTPKGGGEEGSVGFRRWRGWRDVWGLGRGRGGRVGGVQGGGW